MSEIEFNKDELNAPSWMNKEFFRIVLEKSAKSDDLVIHDVKLTPASAKGDHYASVMFRGVVTYDTKEIKDESKSLIIKTMPELEGHKKDFVKESFLFETEITMYSKIIPKFELELRKIGDDTVLGAKVLYYSLEPRKCIVFEDIVPLGYETLRERHVDITETKAALLKLSKWHAVSYKLAAEGDKSVTDLKESFVNMKDIEKEPFFSEGMSIFIEKIETIQKYQKYVPKLRLIENDIFDRFKSSYNSYRQGSLEGIFVLCHGDFHAKNMMFKRNNKREFEDVMLIDFQLCFFGPAILDIMYGIYTLLNSESRLHHQDELIYFYASNFIETLKKIKFPGKIPKVADFFIELYRHVHVELFLLAVFLPMSYAFFKEKVDAESLFTSKNARKEMLDSPDYLKDLDQLLPRLFYKGCLEK